MPKVLPEIIYFKDKNNNPTLDSSNSSYIIPYYKDSEYFDSYESYIKFIKGCERCVRSNDRYRKYIHFLKEEVKLDRCQVLRNITDEDAEIEMHHAILTLFDICAIVVEYFLIKGWKISTFRIADAVLDEHQANRVAVVMLSVTCHEAVHAGKLFISYKQIYGNLPAFIKKYDIAIGNDLREKINNYIDKSMLLDSTDFGVLNLNPALYKIPKKKANKQEGKE